MREIKFRVWSNQLNKLVYPSESGWFDKCFIGENGFYQTCQLGTALDKNGKELEVMQYTGLLDKNGNEIYEGDILETSDKAKAKVIYSEKYLAYYIEWLDVKSGLALSLWSSKELEVIGNIYEIPSPGGTT